MRPTLLVTGGTGFLGRHLGKTLSENYNVILTGRNNKQRETLISLGLNKINRERTLECNPAIQGMIDKVKHLIKVDEVK